MNALSTTRLAEALTARELRATQVWAHVDSCRRRISVRLSLSDGREFTAEGETESDAIDSLINALPPIARVDPRRVLSRERYLRVGARSATHEVIAVTGDRLVVRRLSDGGVMTLTDQDCASREMLESLGFGR